MQDQAVQGQVLADTLADTLAAALQQARPHEPVQRLQTHVSWVLLQGEQAYKLKKPVALGFLDFTTVAARHRACEAELRLNRRYAPDLYLDVLPVLGPADAPRLGRRGESAGGVLDHVVHMRRFPPGALFSERLAAGRLEARHVEALAQRLANVQHRAEPAPPQSDWGTPATLTATTQALVRALAERASPAQAAQLAALQHWLHQQAGALNATWVARREAGFVREGHGDLHLGNAVVLQRPEGDDATAFDCIEFDPALRWIDVVSDVAFMMMDLLAHGRRDLAHRFLDAWLTATGDHAGLAVLRHQLVARALVRARVRLLTPSATGPGDLAHRVSRPDYLAHALSLSQSAAPRLLVMHGLSGSGKSHLACGLLEAAGAVRIRSDVERKRLHGLHALQLSGSGNGAGLYTADANRRTYDELARRAALSLQAGWPTVIDAACLQRGERAGFEALARSLRVPFLLVHCQASEAVMQRRIEQRRARGGDASEADLTVLARQQAEQQPLQPDEATHTLQVDTNEPVDVAALAAQWLQRSTRPA